jgi:pimeloyl-CoA dehydrogenase small subunit
MDFDLSEEQSLVADNVARLMKDKYGFEQRAGYKKSPLGFSEELWAQYAEMGLLGAAFSEEDGGFGGGAVERMLIAEPFGRALALEPYLASVVLAGGAVRHAGGAEQRQALLGGVVSGETRLALAHTERAAGWNAFDVTTRAVKDGSGYRISGEKGLVIHGDSAHKFVVLARTAGDQRERAGLGLFVVDASAEGVSRRGYETQDGQRAAEVSFANVHVAPENVLGNAEGAASALDATLDEATATLCAEAVGAMSEAIEITTEYLKTRKQFGVAIGSFQALQHRASDMVVALEQARSMMYYAAMMADSSDAAARGQAISAAKAQIGRSAKFIGQQATQLHGGIAMTYEYKLGHLFKRMTMIDMSYGDADWRIKKLGEGASLFSA